MRSKESLSYIIIHIILFFGRADLGHDRLDIHGRGLDNPRGSRSSLAWQFAAAHHSVVPTLVPPCDVTLWAPRLLPRCLVKPHLHCTAGVGLVVMVLIVGHAASGKRMLGGVVL